MDASSSGTQEFANGMLARKVGGKPNVPRPLLTHSHDNHIMLLFGEGERSILIDEVTDDIIDQWHRSGKKNIRKVRLDPVCVPTIKLDLTLFFLKHQLSA